MKITALEQQVKNSQRVSVFVDNKYSFSLSLDELIRYKVKQNDELSVAEVKKFKKISEDGKLKAWALEWLLNRPHSEREFKDYLYRKKAAPEQIRNLINDFSQKKYLDDAKFAIWFVDLQTRRGKSNRAIRSGLFTKGINRKVADEVLAGSENNEKKRLESLIAKKTKLLRYQNDPLKLKQYLAQQGFDYELINRTLKNT
ncbi:MAG: RecX family transcriptional regulator [Candidatus Saccharimonadales bacterium]|jgi:regulatory protein